jgi:hypothetical protein
MAVTATLDQRSGAAVAGRIHHQGHSAILAVAWIETLHNHAERSAERHLRSA